MIEGYVGLIGGGKSYNATKRMLEYIASGGAVYTNMSLVLDEWYNLAYRSKMAEYKISYVPWSEGTYCCKLGKEEFVFRADGLCVARCGDDGSVYVNSVGIVKYLRDVYRWRYQEGQYVKLLNEDLTGAINSLLPKGTPDKPVLAVLDEAVDFFDTDDRGKANKEFLSFLRQSRKQCVDLIFIAQDYSELNKRIRNQTHHMWTFTDMYTFKVPGLRARLPPPWRNMILANEWNSSMTGSPIGRKWVSRDPRIFGCYRTDELFRALSVGEGKTDFSGEGVICGENKSMNKVERVFLLLAVILSVFSLAASRGKVGSSSTIESVDSAAVSQDVGCKVIYGRFQSWRVNDEIGVIVDGFRRRVGDITEWGVVVAVSAESVHIKGKQGDVFMYPLPADEKSSPELSLKAS